jgi:hypothetical protein
MELKFVNVFSVAMMDKENINNMQIVDTQDNQLIEETQKMNQLHIQKIMRIPKL